MNKGFGGGGDLGNQQSPLNQHLEVNLQLLQHLQQKEFLDLQERQEQQRLSLHKNMLDPVVSASLQQMLQSDDILQMHQQHFMAQQQQQQQFQQQLPPNLLLMAGNFPQQQQQQQQQPPTAQQQGSAHFGCGNSVPASSSASSSGMLIADGMNGNNSKMFSNLNGDFNNNNNNANIYDLKSGVVSNPTASAASLINNSNHHANSNISLPSSHLTTSVAAAASSSSASAAALPIATNSRDQHAYSIVGDTTMNMNNSTNGNNNNGDVGYATGDEEMALLRCLDENYRLMLDNKAEKLRHAKLASQFMYDPGKGDCKDDNNSEAPQSRYWTAEEHSLFLEAANHFGFKDVKAISVYVGTRNPTQVRTHAQKFLIKMQKDKGGSTASGGSGGSGDYKYDNDNVSTDSDGPP